MQQRIHEDSHHFKRSRKYICRIVTDNLKDTDQILEKSR